MSSIDANSGPFAPVSAEMDVQDIPVAGALPPDLNGILLRNGPNPYSGRFDGHDVQTWWTGAAMIHGIYIRQGRVSYRNRWPRTKAWGEYFGARRLDTLLPTNPNVHLIYHASELLALSEGGAPLRITRGLETLGPPIHHPGLASGMTAHPKVDPQTGELIVFRADWRTPEVMYRVYAADGTLLHDDAFTRPKCAMIHDFAITPDHSIFPDLNVVCDPSLLSSGHRLPLRWDEAQTARLGLLPRRGGTMRWFEIEPCFIQHVANAFNFDSQTVVLDAVRYPSYFVLDSKTNAYQRNPLGTLHRYILDLSTGAVQERELHEQHVEFPRINDNLIASEHRYIYCAEQPSDVEIRGILRFDCQTGAVLRHAIPKGDQNSEPIFIPRSTPASEDDGWLLVCVYRHKSNTSEVLVLDAKDISRPPVASIPLPCRIPAGFHGIWLPEAPPT